MGEDVQKILKPTVCAICGTDSHDEQLYPASFDADALTPEIFSARRLPDRLHYRIVRCLKCGLVRSNPVVEESTLARLYQESHFTYEEESPFAAETYARYLQNVLKDLARPLDATELLEVGCGNGFFLRKAKALGIREVWGIEPSWDAWERSGDLRSHIKLGMFGRDYFPGNSFDVICAFQVFDHLSQPNDFLQICRYYLKPRGILLMINHDIGSIPARWLGRKCPMVDIEHPFLYDVRTFREILKKNEFDAVKVFSVVNRYPLRYWLRLLPLSGPCKEGLMKMVNVIRLGRIPVAMAPGNMGVVAIKDKVRLK